MSDESLEQLEVLAPDVQESMERAAIDTQISTAHRYPRSMDLFKKRALSMATLDIETAASCIYARPVGDGKIVEGESIRLAEIVGASYGNLRVAARIVEQTERYVKAVGMAHDLESNFASQSEVIESTVMKNGRPYSERQRAVVAKVACAKARRDATFQVVPKALCKPIYLAAKQVAIGDEKTLKTRQEAALSWIKKIGIDPSKVWATLGIKGPDDLNVEKLELLTGLKTAINDGDITAEQAFSPREPEPSLGAQFDPPLSAWVGPGNPNVGAPQTSNPPPAEAASPKPATEAPAAPQLSDRKEQLQNTISAAGIGFEQFRAWLGGLQTPPHDGSQWAEMMQVPEAILKTMLEGKVKEFVAWKRANAKKK